jgi:hypothetical protein
MNIYLPLVKDEIIKKWVASRWKIKIDTSALYLMTGWPYGFCETSWAHFQRIY